MFGQKEGLERYKKFITWLYKLIVEQKTDFDLIIGPANSGIFLAESARILYTLLGKEIPKILIIPIQRREKPGVDQGNYFDNTPVSEYVRKELSNLKKIEKVLFVDDEVGEAYTPREAIRVVLMSVDKQIVSERVLYTILAENHGFEWRNDIPPVAIRYFAFGNKYRDEIEHINGSVFYMMSGDIYDKYSDYTFLRDNLDNTTVKRVEKKEMSALFSNGQVQVSHNKIPVLTKDLLNRIESEVKEFDFDREKFMAYTREIIQDVIQNFDVYNKDPIFQKFDGNWIK